MNFGKTSFILFVIFLLISSLASAVEISPQSLSGALCPRETGLFTHSVRNDGNVPRDYTVNLRGSAAAWSTSVPRGFILGAGEQENLYTYITPTQSTEPGTYNIEIEVSSPGDTKNVRHSVNVKNCYNVNLSPAVSTLSSCPSQAVRYSVTLTNSGEYSETFQLSVTGEIVDRVSLSDRTVILGKGQSKSILLFVNSPADAGEYNFNLVVNSESGRIRESLPLFLNVDSCYDFALTVRGNNTYNVCERTYVSIPLNLRNDGTTINTYKIELEGPVWVRLERNEFTLKDREARTFDLAFAPTYGVSGDYAIRVTVVPERGNTKLVTDFGVTVRKCNSVDVQFLVEKADTCKGAVNNYDVLVVNDGEVRKTYRIEVDGPSWIDFDQRNRLLTLNPGSQQKITISAIPTGNVEEQDYALRLGAVATDESGVSARDSDEMILSVKDADECYRPRIETLYEDLIVYYDSSIAVPVEIRNDGLRTAQFGLSLTGNGAVFSTLNPSAVTVDAGKSEIVYLYLAPDVNVELGKYDLSIALNVKGGPLLATKDFDVEITNVRERATPVVQSGEEATGETEASPSLLSRIRSWFRRTFAGDDQFNTNFTILPVLAANETSSNPQFFSKYKYPILAAVILILLLILLFISGLFRKIFLGSKKKSKKKYFDDDED